MRMHLSLPSVFLHGFARAMPHVRRQVHWRALHHVALPVSFSRSPRALVPTPSSPPSCAGTPPTRARTVDRAGREPLRVSASGFVLDGARCFVIEPTCLCLCLRHGLRAGNKRSFEDGGGQFPQLCRRRLTTEWPAPRPVAEEHLNRCLPLPPPVALPCPLRGHHL